MVIEMIPYRQWVFHSDLASGQANLQQKLEDLDMSLIMTQENENHRSGRAVDFCFSSTNLGNLGNLHLAPLDATQILLTVSLPQYPSDEEILIYESRVREAIPPPAFALRMHDLYGTEKVREYLCRILHQLRLQTLEHICNELALSSEGVPVEDIKLLSNVSIEGTNEPPSLTSSQLQKGYPDNIPTEETCSVGNIPTTGNDDQQVIQLWKEGRSAKRIAQLTGKTEKTILNRLSLLRKTYGDQAVPRRR